MPDATEADIAGICARMNAGDPSAVEDLARLAAPTLYHRLVRAFGNELNHHDREDVIQTVLARVALQRLGGLDASRRPLAYLKKAVCNEARDTLRKRRKVEVRHRKYAVRRQAAGAETSGCLGSTSEELANVVEGLSPEESAVTIAIGLAWPHSHAAVLATTEDIGRSTAQARINKTLKHLRARLGEDSP